MFTRLIDWLIFRSDRMQQLLKIARIEGAAQERMHAKVDQSIREQEAGMTEDAIEESIIK